MTHVKIIKIKTPEKEFLRVRIVLFLNMIGYACINMSVEKGISTNRKLTKKTFDKFGPDKVSDLAVLNSADLLKILEWNANNGIKFFRMSSDIIPRGDLVKLSTLKDYDIIKNNFKSAGDFAKAHNMRLTFHPGPFNVLGSPSEKALLNTFSNLELHGEIMDMMELSCTPYNKINIHCNGTYGDKKNTMYVFSKNFDLLSESVKNRLTVENDDKASMYSVQDLMTIHERTGIPIVFDYHHHKFCDGGLSEKEALELAISTWKDITPVVHYSESAIGKKLVAHSDYIEYLPNTYGNNIDLMVEAKAKNLAIQKFL